MNDSEEIVVKPLGRHLKDCQGFAGATIMGNGKVALILDVASIGEMCALKPKNTPTETDQRATEKNIAVDQDECSKAYLFFSNAATERFAVPLDLVARIEKIDAAEIEIAGGSRVLKYRGGTLPLLALEDAILVDPLPERNHYQVICFRVTGRELVFRAPPPTAAAELTLRVATTTLKQPGVIGSAVIMDQTTLILEIEQIVRTCKPDVFNEACVNE